MKKRNCWVVEKDDKGLVRGIGFDAGTVDKPHVWTVIALNPGAERNGQTLADVVALLNRADPLGLHGKRMVRIIAAGGGKRSKPATTRSCGLNWRTSWKQAGRRCSSPPGVAVTSAWGCCAPSRYTEGRVSLARSASTPCRKPSADTSGRACLGPGSSRGRSRAGWGR